MENDYQEINLRDLLFVLLKRWWIIALCFVVCTIITAVVSIFFIDPTYKSQTSLFVGKEKSKQSTQNPLDYNELRFNQQLVSDYSELAKRNVVVKEVIDRLGLDISVDSFRNRISVGSIRDTRFFNISFEDSDPVLATKIVNELADVFIQKAIEIVNVENIQVVDVAEVPLNPIKPRVKVNIVIGAVLGLMLGVFIAFIMEFLDNTIKTPNDIEKYLGISSLGAIPVFNGEERTD